MNSSHNTRNDRSSASPLTRKKGITSNFSIETQTWISPNQRKSYVLPETTLFLYGDPLQLVQESFSLMNLVILSAKCTQILYFTNTSTPKHPLSSISNLRHIEDSEVEGSLGKLLTIWFTIYSSQYSVVSSTFTHYRLFESLECIFH